MSLKVVRIFNTYGVNMQTDDGRVVSNFICQALQNRNLTVYGNGSQTRSFCYVKDLITVIHKYMAVNEKLAGPFNIGNPSEFTILELAQKVIKKVQSSSEITFLDIPEDDPKQRRPDITAAQAAFEWKPVIGLDEGLERTIEYFKAALTQEQSQSIKTLKL